MGVATGVTTGEGEGRGDATGVGVGLCCGDGLGDGAGLLGQCTVVRNRLLQPPGILLPWTSAVLEIWALQARFASTLTWNKMICDWPGARVTGWHSSRPRPKLLGTPGTRAQLPMVAETNVVRAGIMSMILTLWAVTLLVFSAFTR